jgi:flagellar hook-length control protein FliK
VSGTPIPPDENVTRLIQAMRVQVASGSLSEATVQLRPEHLGEVTVSVRVDHGSVSAVVHAETADVRDWLRSREDSLRSGLADHGLQLDRLVVQRDRPHDRQPQQQQPRPPRTVRRGTATPRFDVTV